MYAIINDRGKQYKVSEGDVIAVDLLSGAEVGQAVEFGKVLLVQGDQGTQVGSPVLEGAKVAGEVVDEVKGDKIYVFKFKRRKGYARSRGHRQQYTRVKINQIAG